MILYRPVDGDVHTHPIKFRCKTCFIMTKLSNPTPDISREACGSIEAIFEDHNISCVDAESITTGRDFLSKIWDLIISVPIGVAIVHEDYPSQTVANIFYEVGLFHALGKEVLIVKSKGFKIPSDFVRTEYVVYNDSFDTKFRNFVSGLDGRVEYYIMLAQQVENNPLLAIDYYRRAYLLSGDDSFKDEAVKILQGAGLEGRAKSSVEMLLSGFAFMR